MAKDKIYVAEMGQPPKEPDDASAGKTSKRDQPEQPGSGILVDGKPLKRAKGGSVSSASARADGIVSKGKTKGTMVVMCGGGKAKK